MKPDDLLDQRLSGLSRSDLDEHRSQRLRARAHAELRRTRESAENHGDWVEPLLLASCAAVVLVRLVWFVVNAISATV